MQLTTNDINLPLPKNINYNTLNQLSNNPQIKKIQNYLFNLNDILGKGNFSQVYKAINQVTKQIVAIKVVQLSSMKTPALRELLDSEIEILKLIHHPNILNSIQIFSSINNCYIVTELCSDGDVQTKLRNQGPFEQKVAKKLIYEVFLGLKYLKSKHIVHRDLKVANIFLKNNVAKIADFGFAKRTTEQFKDINIGSPIYMSPQGLLENIYGPKTDVWAFGVFLYQILHGDTPLCFCKSESQLKFQILNPIPYESIKTQISNDLKDLILRCLQVNHQKRISIDEIQMHRYIQQAERQYYMKHLSSNRVNPRNNNISQNMVPYQNQGLSQKPINQGANNGASLQIDPKFQYLKKYNPPSKINSHSQNKNDSEKIKLEIPLPINQKKIISPKSPSNLGQNPYLINNLPLKTENSEAKRYGSLQKQRTLINNNYNYQSPQINKINHISEQMIIVNNIPKNEHSYTKNSQNSKQKVKSHQFIISNSVSFAECIQILHYLRLIFKSIGLLKKLNRPNTQKLIDIYSKWLLDVISEIRNKVSDYAKFQGQRAVIKQKKLKQVIAEYFQKYQKQLNQQSKGQCNLLIIQNYTIKYLFYIDSQINMNPPDKPELLNISHFLFCIFQSGIILEKCLELNQFKLLVKNTALQSFLNTKNFDVLSYALIQSELKKFRELKQQI